MTALDSDSVDAHFSAVSESLNARDRLRQEWLESTDDPEQLRSIAWKLFREIDSMSARLESVTIAKNRLQDAIMAPKQERVPAVGHPTFWTEVRREWLLVAFAQHYRARQVRDGRDPTTNTVLADIIADPSSPHEIHERSVSALRKVFDDSIGPGLETIKRRVTDNFA